MMHTANSPLHTALAALLLVAPQVVDGQPPRQGAANAPHMASVDTALLRGMQYRFVGHTVGGRVTAVTGVPSQPRTFYMGVASGGVFRTTDAGESWHPITDGQVPVGSIGDIAVSLSNPRVMYIGTGSDGARSNVSTGRGVYKSTDGGATWSFAGLYNVGQIGAVRIHPTNPDIVWVAANGDMFKPTRERGVYKTTDGGKTWKRTLYVSDSTGAMDVELDARDPNTVYAWMSRIERKPWTIISGSREGGFYKSTDGGETWRRGAAGLPTGLLGKGNLAVTAANPRRIYLLVEALPGGGLYRSDDGGQSFALVNTTPGLTQRPFYYTTIGADPTNADVVYAGAETFYKSTDGGRTLTVLRTPHVDNHDIWIDPSNGNIMVQANDGGANVSYDGGRTWSTQLNQPTAEFYGVEIDRNFPYRLYVAQQDNSTYIINPFGGDPFNSIVRTGPGCETGPIFPHPAETNIIYGNCKGQFSVMNTDIGQSRNYWVGGQSLYGNAGQDLIYRFQRVTPMATSPHDPNVMYYGSQYLHRTRDKGVTWERMSPDLTAFPECCQGASGEPITRDVTGEEFFSTLYAITESPHEPGVIWTGSNDGPFHITRDNGKTWSNITPKDLPWGGRVAWIEASPHRRGSAYYAVYRYLLGDYEPYLYRTDDYGKTWTRLTNGKNGIPVDYPTRVVREDPMREGLLYAGTEFGIFISFDNGAHWQPFQQNLPHVPINQIKVHQNDLIIATQGRGLWMMDNLSALHQITPNTRIDAVTVYTPREGYRTSTGAAFLGPQVEYYLPRSEAVRIEILDSNGQVVNNYSSEAPPQQQARGGRRGGGGGAVDSRARAQFPAPQMNVVTRNVGHNRFTWSVTHSSGLGAPPGRYQARVSVGSVTRTVPLTVRIDPRLEAEGITTADLQTQFAHNMKMRDMVREVGALVTRLRDAETRLSSANSPASADTLSRVRSLLEKLLPEPVRYGKPGLQTHITYLAGMTSRADQKVGRDAFERHAVLRKELDVVTQEAERVLGRIQ